MQICMHHQVMTPMPLSLNVMILGLVSGLPSSLTSCCASPAISEQESCQDAVIIPAQTWHLDLLLLCTSSNPLRESPAVERSMNVDLFCTPMPSLPCAVAGWLSPKSIGIAAFMANVVLRIPFFRQWQATKRASQLSSAHVYHVYAS